MDTSCDSEPSSHGEAAVKFDLRATIRAVLAESVDPDPHGVARDVLARISAKDTREALAQALDIAVRQMISSGRMRDTTGVPVTAGGATGTAPSRPVRNSAAVVREAWRRHLDDRLPGAEGWKFLKDFTAADLDFAADLRDRHAAANSAQAERMRALKKAIAVADVTTVGELPDDVLQDLLDD